MVQVWSGAWVIFIKRLPMTNFNVRSYHAADKIIWLGVWLLCFVGTKNLLPFLHNWRIWEKKLSDNQALHLATMCKVPKLKVFSFLFLFTFRNMVTGPITRSYLYILCVSQSSVLDIVLTTITTVFLSKYSWFGRSIEIAKVATCKCM